MRSTGAECINLCRIIQRFLFRMYFTSMITRPNYFRKKKLGIIWSYWNCWDQASSNFIKKYSKREKMDSKCWRILINTLSFGTLKWNKRWRHCKGSNRLKLIFISFARINRRLKQLSTSKCFCFKERILILMWRLSSFILMKGIKSIMKNWLMSLLCLIIHCARKRRKMRRFK